MEDIEYVEEREAKTIYSSQNMQIIIKNCLHLFFPFHIV